MGIPGSARLGLNVREPGSGGRIGNADEVMAARTFDLAAGVTRIAFERLVAMRAVEFEFVGGHGRSLSNPPIVVNRLMVCMHLMVKPRARVAPPALSRGARDAEDRSGFFDGEASEIPEFDQFGFGLVEGDKSFESVIDGEKFIIRSRGGDFEFVNVQALLIAAMAPGAFAAGALDQDAAHGFGGGREKVSAIFPR